VRRGGEVVGLVGEERRRRWAGGGVRGMCRREGLWDGCEIKGEGTGGWRVMVG